MTSLIPARPSSYVRKSRCCVLVGQMKTALLEILGTTRILNRPNCFPLC